MRIAIAAALIVGLAVAGCSQQTQDNADAAAKSAAADAASNTQAVLDQGASAVGSAASNLQQEASEATTDASTPQPSGTPSPQ